jgi:hypothetical protein
VPTTSAPGADKGTPLKVLQLRKSHEGSKTLHAENRVLF